MTAPDALADAVDLAPPAHAAAVFGDALPVLEQYAALLARAGVERGLIGPRETPRLWERHLLNCAGLAELLEPGQVVADVGSGPGCRGSCSPPCART
jgi:16S rRNA (guanine527-N7)-methyltransferase